MLMCDEYESAKEEHLHSNRCKLDIVMSITKGRGIDVLLKKRYMHSLI